MKSLWKDTDASEFAGDDLQLRVYTSRLLGMNADLVLHGGGNTSVKTEELDIFGDLLPVLHVKGSGWDLKTIEAAGFAPVRLKQLQRLAVLSSMSDVEMARELKAALIDPGAPSPSVEAILHALVPARYVDHTHADAIVTISNSPDGEQILAQLYGPEVLILPYVMPGFILARQVFEATRNIDWAGLKGIVLLHHGVITFADDAKVSYEAMIHLVTQAEQYLADQGAMDSEKIAGYEPTGADLQELAFLRKQVSQISARPTLARWECDQSSVGFSCRDDAFGLVSSGPLTPDHTLLTKRTGACLGDAPGADIEMFVQEYENYFARFNKGNLTQLDPAPRYAVWRGRGKICFAHTTARMKAVEDITAHTFAAMQRATVLGGWSVLPESDIFDIEYWDLEQAKLKRPGGYPAYEGKVVLVTGAASGIGKACVEAFLAQGAAVAGLDIAPEMVELSNHASALGLCCDVTDGAAVVRAIQQVVGKFGGIDVVVSNAGSFPQSRRLEQLSDAEFESSLDLNLKSHLRVIRESTPFLKHGLDPAILIVASKNVPAPGPGAGAYSAAKAALTQLARVAALELAEFGIRVNVVHPNAVFDTGIWTDEVLGERATHYGLTVDEYKRNNLLRREITSADVARLVVTMCGASFRNTTGAQVPIDGGNDRVI